MQYLTLRMKKQTQGLGTTALSNNSVKQVVAAHRKKDLNCPQPFQFAFVKATPFVVSH